MSEKLEPIGHISEYGLDKLRTRRHYCVAVSHQAEKEFTIGLVTLSSATSALEAKDARIAELERENAALAAHACIFTDGSGLTGDEHGNSICLVTRRATAAEAEAARLRGLLEEAGKALEPFARDDRALTKADVAAARSIHSRIREKGE